MAHARLLPRQYTILLMVSLCAPRLGDSCLSRGMTSLPPLSLAHPATLIAAIFTPWIALGIVLLYWLLRLLPHSPLLGRLDLCASRYGLRLRYRRVACPLLASRADLGGTLGGNRSDHAGRQLCCGWALPHRATR